MSFRFPGERGIVTDRFRKEKDALGEVLVPQEAHWGIQTQRAIENFPISGQRFPRVFLKALGHIKFFAAQTNLELGLLKPEMAEAIQKAAKEVAEGKLDDQFVVDIYQTGSGTSTHMNANEVIASRANELLGTGRGLKFPVHPNDHVNMGQSSNDVIPTAIHIAAYDELRQRLMPSLQKLAKSFEIKVHEFFEILKIGRTHLQDAVPMRLSQEFGAYGTMVRHAMVRLEHAEYFLAEIPIGGTAIGTGLNAHPEFGSCVTRKLAQHFGYPFRQSEDKFEAIGSKDALVELSGALKVLAVSLFKIANDIRILNSGPRCGIGEVRVVALQPGSSIMPGKVNPVIPEVVCQVASRVIGNDATITIGGASGNLELNTMMPVMAHALLESLNLLSNALEVFRTKCLEGLLADSERCLELLEKSLALVTALSPKIGYEKASEIAKKAYDSKKSLKEVLYDERVLSQEEIDRLLDPASMIG